MKSIKASKGFTLIEILTVLFVVGVLSSVLYQGYDAYIFNSKMAATAEGSNALLSVLEYERGLSRSTTVSGTPPIYSHGQISVAAGTTIGALELLIGRPTGIRSNNPFGNPYTVEITRFYSRVVSIVPGDSPLISAQGTSLIGANTQLAFVSNGSLKSNVLTSKLKLIKSSYYGERVN